MATRHSRIRAASLPMGQQVYKTLNLYFESTVPSCKPPPHQPAIRDLAMQAPRSKVSSVRWAHTYLRGWKAEIWTSTFSGFCEIQQTNIDFERKLNFRMQADLFQLERAPKAAFRTFRHRILCTDWCNDASRNHNLQERITKQRSLSNCSRLPNRCIDLTLASCRQQL